MLICTSRVHLRDRLVGLLLLQQMFTPSWKINFRWHEKKSLNTWSKNNWRGKHLNLKTAQNNHTLQRLLCWDSERYELSHCKAAHTSTVIPFHTAFVLRLKAQPYFSPPKGEPTAPSKGGNHSKIWCHLNLFSILTALTITGGRTTNTIQLR